MTQEPGSKRDGFPPSIVDGAELGRRIRRLRLERGLTLKQLEESAGLSATHLSEIERGNTSPTLGALVRIARSLDRDPSYFVESEEREEILHLPLEACRTFTPVRGVSVEILTLGIPGSRMLAYRLRFDVGARTELGLRSRSITGEAIYMVWRGTIETDLGEGPVTLGLGDALQATFGRPHRLVSSGEEAADVIVVSQQPIDFAAPR